MNNKEYTKGKKGTYPSLREKVSYFYLNFDTVINLHLKRSLRDFFRFFFFLASNKENTFRGKKRARRNTHTLDLN